MVTASGPLDLDHVGTQIAEKHGAVGAGKRFRQFENTQTVREQEMSLIVTWQTAAYHRSVEAAW